MGKSYGWILWGVNLFGIFSLLFSIWEYFQGTYERGHALLFIGQALFGILLIYLPQIIRRLFRIQFPVATIYFYWFFLILSVFMGTILHFIEFISFWDKVLHLISPMVLTATGYGLICLLLKDAAIKDVSPWLFLIGGFAIASLCGVLWEFWEFLCDSVADMNLQRYATLDGENFIGRAALMDTMGDLLTNTIGAFFMSLLAFVQSRGKSLYYESFRIMYIKKG